MFESFGKIFNKLIKSEKSDFIELNKKNTDKEYIIDNNEYYDHPEPKVMTDEEIIMGKQITEKLTIEESETVNQAVFRMPDGREVSGNALRDLMHNPEADNYVIPGQVIPGKKLVDMRHSNPSNTGAGIPIQHEQLKQYEGEVTIPVQGGTKLPPYFLYTTEDAFYFFIELSGILKDKLDVKFNDRQLTISGEYLDFSDVVKARVKSKKLAAGITKTKGKADPIISEKSNIKRELTFKYQFTMSKSVDERAAIAIMSEIPGVLLLELPFKALIDDVSVTIL